MSDHNGAGPAWVRDGDVRAALDAVARELELALAEPHWADTRRRLVRLRIMLLAVIHTDRPPAEAMADMRDVLAQLTP
jgi:hypothetical protein